MLPKKGEIVVCKITKVNPYSAFVFLEEYEKEGMLHISEITGGWVRDIRKHLKEGQIVVARVLTVTEGKINVSIKRVDQNQKRNKLMLYKKEKRAERMLDVAGKKLKQTKDLNEIKNRIKSEIGSIYNCFELSIKNEKQLEKCLSKKWIEAIKEIAIKNIQEKEFEFKAKIELKSYEPNGINLIKDTLNFGEESGLDIIYISAPEYLIKFRTNQPKKGEQEFNKKLNELEKTAKINKCFESIELIK